MCPPCHMMRKGTSFGTCPSAQVQRNLSKPQISFLSFRFTASTRPTENESEHGEVRSRISSLSEFPVSRRHLGGFLVSFPSAGGDTRPDNYL